ncbi:hypothetical protein [Streptomyces sp. SAI-229]|jgi:hypothetical protein|uniref:hypothetical protein n=1 Tax=Streptomyces sp. SAI-229 TaxID=3377731 RepID=UPI003C7A66AB
MEWPACGSPEYVEQGRLHIDDTFEDEVRAAHNSIRLWAPRVANRVRGILPLPREATGRGVRVTVFIRDDTDQLQTRPANQSLITDLRAVVHTVTPVNVMHHDTVRKTRPNGRSRAWNQGIGAGGVRY